MQAQLITSAVSLLMLYASLALQHTGTILFQLIEASSVAAALVLVATLLAYHPSVLLFFFRSPLERGKLSSSSLARFWQLGSVLLVSRPFSLSPLRSLVYSAVHVRQA